MIKRRKKDALSRDRYNIEMVQEPAPMAFYKNAKTFADTIDITKRTTCFLGGSFVFGDAVEALIMDRGLEVEKLTIFSYSMSENNIDSLNWLLEDEYVDELTIILSSFFFSDEKGANGLVQYMIEQLDISNRTQIAFCCNHIKAVIMKTVGGQHIVMYGSANYRAANCIEQLVVEPSKELYDFYDNLAKDIVDKYKLINKEVQTKDLHGLMDKLSETHNENLKKTHTLNN